MNGLSPFPKVYPGSITLINATRVYAQVLVDATTRSVLITDEAPRQLVVDLIKSSRRSIGSFPAIVTVVKVDRTLNLDHIITMVVDFLGLGWGIMGIHTGVRKSTIIWATRDRIHDSIMVIKGMLLLTPVAGINNNNDHRTRIWVIRTNIEAVNLDTTMAHRRDIINNSDTRLSRLTILLLHLSNLVHRTSNSSLNHLLSNNHTSTHHLPLDHLLQTPIHHLHSLNSRSPISERESHWSRWVQLRHFTLSRLKPVDEMSTTAPTQLNLSPMAIGSLSRLIEGRISERLYMINFPPSRLGNGKKLKLPPLSCREPMFTNHQVWPL
jgi:hypothetical protein